MYLPIVYTIAFIIGLLANSWGLKSLLQKWKRIGNINIFVLNLGFADVLYLLTLPFLIVYHARDQWIFGNIFCKITRFCFNVNLYGSIGFLTCISLYRYLGIVHPMRVRGRISAQHSVVISVLVWVLVSIQSLPDMFFTKFYKNTTGRCYETTSKYKTEDYLNYSLGWTLSGFCLPLLIIVGCYGHVAVVLCTKTTVDQTLKRKCLKFLFVLIVLFSVCYIPYHVLKNLNLKTRVLQRRGVCYSWFPSVYVAHQISRGLVSLNCAFNPLVYLHGDDDLIKRLRELWDGFYRASFQWLPGNYQFARQSVESVPIGFSCTDVV
ncbi:P2Y purinoceptor 1 [Aplochiton taeniatus]